MTEPRGLTPGPSWGRCFSFGGMARRSRGDALRLAKTLGYASGQPYLNWVSFYSAVRRVGSAHDPQLKILSVSYSVSYGLCASFVHGTPDPSSVDKWRSSSIERAKAHCLEVEKASFGCPHRESSWCAEGEGRCGVTTRREKRGVCRRAGQQCCAPTDRPQSDLGDAYCSMVWVDAVGNRDDCCGKLQ